MYVTARDDRVEHPHVFVNSNVDKLEVDSEEVEEVTDPVSAQIEVLLPVDEENVQWT